MNSDVNFEKNKDKNVDPNVGMEYNSHSKTLKIVVKKVLISKTKEKKNYSTNQSKKNLFIIVRSSIKENIKKSNQTARNNKFLITHYEVKKDNNENEEKVEKDNSENKEKLRKENYPLLISKKEASK